MRITPERYASSTCRAGERNRFFLLNALLVDIPESGQRPWVLMMKITLLTTSRTIDDFVACSSQQEEDYIKKTPEAEQIADLQDDDKDGVVNAWYTPGTPETSQVDNGGVGRPFQAEGSQTAENSVCPRLVRS